MVKWFWTAASWSESQFSVPDHKLCATCFSINTIAGTWTLCPFSWGAGRRKCYNHRYLLGDWLCSLSSQITTVPGVTQHTFYLLHNQEEMVWTFMVPAGGKLEFIRSFIHSFILHTIIFQTLPNTMGTIQSGGWKQPHCNLQKGWS